jgi:hypothetical protein
MIAGKCGQLHEEMLSLRRAAFDCPVFPSTVEAPRPGVQAFPLQMQDQGNDIFNDPFHDALLSRA